MTPVFITGIGTDVGKTVVSAIVTIALEAGYWKPVQAGSLDATDSHFVQKMIGGSGTFFKETYLLQKPASPHLSAAEENIQIDLQKIHDDLRKIERNQPELNYLVIEGAGGLLVPLNSCETVADLAIKLKAKVILVSRNYLGSINHSLLTAEACASRNIKPAGWIFTDNFMGYEEEICERTGLPLIAKIPFLETLSHAVLKQLADEVSQPLLAALK